jgi:hypothetical protein
LAFADIALALSAEAFAVSWALALATDAGIADGAGPPASVAPVSAAFLVSELVSDDFSVPDLPCASRFECLELCLVEFADVAVSDFDAAVALLALAALAGNGAAKHANSPVARINAEQPLALIFMCNLPICPPPMRNETPLHVHTGAKKGNLRARRGESWAFFFVADCSGRAAGANWLDRCYDPAARGNLQSQFPGGPPLGAPGVYDHDFVIKSS